MKIAQGPDGRITNTEEGNIAGDITLSEWDVIADLPLTEEQHRVLGYLINQVSLRHTAEMTRVPVEMISNWLRYDPNFTSALSRLQANREAFMRSDLMGLQMKSVEVLAWFLTEDVNARDEEDGSLKYSERMQMTLLQEKRKVAAQIVGSALSRSSIKQVNVTHTIQEQADAEVMKRLVDKLEVEYEEPFRVTHKSEIEAEIDDAVDGELGQDQ